MIFFIISLEKKIGGGESRVCIDCGAHAGLVSDLLLDCGAFVYLFEPNDILFPILQNKYKTAPID